MPNLSASDYTQFLKYKAAATVYNSTQVPRPIGTVDQIVPTKSILNAVLKTSEASLRVTPTVTNIVGLNYVRPMPPNKVNHPYALSSQTYAGMGPAPSTTCCEKA
jgi:hypothetical protein